MDIRNKAQNTHDTTYISYMKVKKMEYQNVGTLVLLRRGNKIITGGRGLEGLRKRGRGEEKGVTGLGVRRDG